MTKRYYNFKDIPESIIKEVETKTENSPFRQKIHIEAKSGYLNDPNGFSYFNGKYHLFYQWSPIRYASEDVWFQGWYHLVSEDLVHWEPVGPGIEPNTIFETHGAYSGSAMEYKDELLIFYTGNTRDEDNIRIPYQMIAHLHKDGQLKKELKPSITGVPNGYTDHFRDPKIWKDNDEFYAVIGAQRKDLTGCSLILQSKNSIDWNVLGEIETSYNNLGYMWECPDYFELDGKGLFIFSPQGLEKEEYKFENIYQTGYIIGETIGAHSKSMKPHSEFIELDRGFDIYATQTTLTPDGRRILIGWMGLPEINYPTEKHAYCGTLTLPRELRVINDKLYQTPVRELKNYREDHQTIKQIVNSKQSIQMKAEECYELECTINSVDMEELFIDVCSNADNQMYTRIHCSKKGIYLNRENSGEAFAEEYGTVRKLMDAKEKVDLNIFVDRSSIEIFINKGEVVASSRIFPLEEQTYIRIHSPSGEYEIKLDYWNLQNIF